MRRMIVLSCIGVFVAVFFLAAYAVAQDRTAAGKAEKGMLICPMHPDVKATWASTCPHCGMALTRPQARVRRGCPCCGMMGRTSKVAETPTADVQQPMMQCPMGMMQRGGAGPAMMRRCRMMMQSRIYADSPNAICAQAQALGLSEGQKKQLLQIENEARKKARGVLTDEQRKKLGDVSDKPMSMMQMCQQMAGDHKGAISMMCPMCPMMQGMRGGGGAEDPNQK